MLIFALFPLFRCGAGAGSVYYPGGQNADHDRELGDVGLVTGADMRDPAVPGDNEAQPDQPQIGALLL
jgi:hypothetical protein